MEDSLRRFLQVASSKREASGLDPEAVHGVGGGAGLVVTHSDDVATAVDPSETLDTSE